MKNKIWVISDKLNSTITNVLLLLSQQWVSETKPKINSWVVVYDWQWNFAINLAQLKTKPKVGANNVIAGSSLTYRLERWYHRNIVNWLDYLSSFDYLQGHLKIFFFFTMTKIWHSNMFDGFRFEINDTRLWVTADRLMSITYIEDSFESF